MPNKVTRELREIAREYVPGAMVELDRLSREAESEAARVAAIKEILDRAHGKAPQALTGEGGGPMRLIVTTGVPRDSAAG